MLLEKCICKFERHVLRRRQGELHVLRETQRQGILRATVARCHYLWWFRLIQQKVGSVKGRTTRSGGGTNGDEDDWYPGGYPDCILRVQILRVMSQLALIHSG